MNAISLGDAYRLTPVDTARPSIDADPVTIDRHALRQRCRGGWNDWCAKTKNQDCNGKKG
jgi:hypothetical protein